MKPVKFMMREEILLGGFHAGPEREGHNHWEKFEAQTVIEDLNNIVNDTGYEVRMFPPEEEQIFTGVQVRDRNILPSYELLAVPSANYAVFDINCKKNMQRQFDGIDRWLEKHKNEHPRRMWDDGFPYIVCWYGRMAKESVFEMWIPLC